MEQNGRLNTSAFVSRSIGGETRRYPSERGSKKRKKGSAYLMVRLGVCAVCFCGVIGLKLAGSDGLIPDGLTEGGESVTDQLGRLRFVELPSIIDVFAPRRTAVLPAAVLSFEIGEDGDGLTIITNGGSDIVSPVSGRVKAVGEDEALGRYVSVITDDDIEFTVYGLDEIAVEQGQPVKQRQKLGVAAHSSVAVKGCKAGRPLDLGEVFGLGDAEAR
ncbi:MAG: M23 family metallopeptidase [Clostridia bacterium]|nr:M23 family metallopeptidase [Clostridia bacterium]